MAVILQVEEFQLGSTIIIANIPNNRFRGHTKGSRGSAASVLRIYQVRHQ